MVRTILIVLSGICKILCPVRDREYIEPFRPKAGPRRGTSRTKKYLWTTVRHRNGAPGSKAPRRARRAKY